MIRKQFTLIAAAVFATMGGAALAQNTANSNTSTTAGQVVAPNASTTTNTESNGAQPHVAREATAADASRSRAPHALSRTPSTMVSMLPLQGASEDLA